MSLTHEVIFGKNQRARAKPTMSFKNGILIVIVAPSGTGKSTLMRRVREDFKGD